MRINAVTSGQTPEPSPRLSASIPPSAPAVGEPSAHSPSGTAPPDFSAASPQVTVSFDDNKAVYRFIDGSSGKVLQQIPPEELLRVMRNIGEWLQQAQKKVDLES
jgi:hypothetical protein